MNIYYGGNKKKFFSSSTIVATKMLQFEEKKVRKIPLKIF